MTETAAAEVELRTSELEDQRPSRIQRVFSEDPAQVIRAPISPAHLAVRASRGKWAYPHHLQYLNRHLTKVLLDDSGRQRFILIELPIRHGKSLYVSRYCTSWFLGRHPDRNVLLTSYGDVLAKKFSREARNVLEEWGPRLFGPEAGVRIDSRAVDRWELLGGGGMTASPLNGLITGVGGDLIVIDDPVKNAKSAHSKSQRDELWEWYQETLRGRLEPGGKIVLVMSRWHSDDLAGRLLVHAANDPGADQWERIRLPALAEPSPEERFIADRAEEPIDLEAWRDPLGRAYGEALWPKRWSRRTLIQVKASISLGAFNANYQQQPSSAEGDVFPRAKWGMVDEAPAGLDLVRRWDLADGLTGDWAAGALVGYPKSPPHFTYILDVVRVRARASDVKSMIVTTAEQDRARYGTVHHVIEQEGGSGGKTVAEEYVRDHLAGFSAEGKPTTGSKELNAVGLSGQQQAGNVFLVKRRQPDGSYAAAPWWQDFIDEAAEFPRGTHDDQIDPASQAYNDLVERARKRRKSKARVGSAANLRME